MNLGICETAFVPLRDEMSHKAEMISQVLFGEVFEIQTVNDEWARVRLLADGYQGWLETKMITFLDNETQAQPFVDKPVHTDDITVLTLDNTTSLTLPIGCSIPRNALKINEFRIKDHAYTLPDGFAVASETDLRKRMISLAQKLINTPYLWGGRSSFGIDCSGFVQLLFAAVGVQLPRDASQQVFVGTTIDFISETMPGDVAFFDNDDGQIVHVGIICNQNKIIHSSGKVRLDDIDHQGIFNPQTNAYTHKLRTIKSIL